MNKYIKRRKRRHAVMINGAAYVLSYLSALAIRFKGGPMAPWQVQMYSAMFISIMLLAAALHFYRVSTKRYKYVEEMDPLETLIYVIRNQVLLLLAIMLYLFATRQSERVSRLAITLFILFNILYEYVLRMLYRRRILRREKNLPIDRAVDVITYKKYEGNIKTALKASLPGNMAVHKIYFWDEKKDESHAFLEGMKAELPVKEVYLYLPGESEEEVKTLIYLLEGKGYSVQTILSCFGNILSEDLLGQDSAYITACFDSLREKCPVLGVNYTVSSPDKAALYIKGHLPELAGQYICFSNVHTTVTARKDPSYLAVQNGSAFTFPDGAPIAKQQVRMGYDGARRVAGPDFMDAMFRFTAHAKVRHFFYGSTQETLDLLKEKLPQKYPGIQIAGVYSPPFRALTEEEDDKIVEDLNNQHADIYWIGLGAPKQEIWMAEHKNRINGVMIGVGAGFNFYAENIKRAPLWMQKAGLEWLYRLTQDPKRLFKRYFVTNIQFAWYILTASLKRDDRKAGDKT